MYSPVNVEVMHRTESFSSKAFFSKSDPLRLYMMRNDVPVFSSTAETRILAALHSDNVMGTNDWASESAILHCRTTHLLRTEYRVKKPFWSSETNTPNTFETSTETMGYSWTANMRSGPVPSGGRVHDNRLTWTIHKATFPSMEPETICDWSQSNRNAETRKQHQ